GSRATPARRSRSSADGSRLLFLAHPAPDPGRVRLREDPAAEQDPPDQVGILRLRLLLLLESPAHVAGRARRQPPGQGRALLQRADRRPERPLGLLGLLDFDALQREGMTDVAAERLVPVHLRLGEPPLAERAHQVRWGPGLLAFDLA